MKSNTMEYRCVICATVGERPRLTRFLKHNDAWVVKELTHILFQREKLRGFSLTSNTDTILLTHNYIHLSFLPFYILIRNMLCVNTLLFCITGADKVQRNNNRGLRKHARGLLWTIHRCQYWKSHS